MTPEEKQAARKLIAETLARTETKKCSECFFKCRFPSNTTCCLDIITALPFSNKCPYWEVMSTRSDVPDLAKLLTAALDEIERLEEALETHRQIDLQCMLEH